MGVDLDAMLFWGLTFASAEPPWASADDYAPDEPWEARFERRKKALAAPDAEAPGCLVEPYGIADRPCLLVAVAESIVRAEWAAATRFEGFGVAPDWPERLRSFCDVLAIPWRPPGWVVVPYLY